MDGINLEDEGGHGPVGVLAPGWHTVTVRSFKEVRANSGNVGIEYTLVCKDGSIRRTFWLSPEAKFRLKNFALCCGYTGKLREFKFKDILGAQVQIEVVQGPKYREVNEYMPARTDGRTQVPDDEDMF